MAKNAGSMAYRILAVFGTTLVWLPILITLLTSVVGSIARRTFLLDYLMPAELFPLSLVGAILLVWAALGARLRRLSVALSAAVMAAFYACLVVVPMVTGLASGATAPEGWLWVLVIVLLALFTAAIAFLGVTGVLLIRDLFQRSGQ